MFFQMDYPIFLPRIFCLLNESTCGSPLSLKSGEPLSYFLGWLGFGFISSTNFYIYQKRMGSGAQGVNLKAWLEWHIFFGMMGPTCILFHTGGTINGLAAIGFWAMMCSFISGIIGRFLYVRILQANTSIRNEIHQLETRIARLADESEGALRPKDLKYIYRKVFQVALTYEPQDLKKLSRSQVLAYGLVGEFKLALWSPGLKYDHRLLKKFFRKWGLLHIRLRCLPSYQKIFANWHGFHAPFAILMYSAVIVHIISSFIFVVE